MKLTVFKNNYPIYFSYIVRTLYHKDEDYLKYARILFINIIILIVKCF